MLLLRLSPQPPTATPHNHHRRLSFPLPSPKPTLLRFPSFLSPSPNPHLRCSSSPLPLPAPSTALSDDSIAGFDEELARLLVLLPSEMRQRVESHPDLPHLVEIVMDIGRRPLARFPAGDFVLSDRPITSQDLHHAASQVGDFSMDNRAGISRTLHRISAIRNRKGAIVGLTCRVGRAVSGSANLLRDLVEDGSSLLLIGPPGVGKTTIIRDIARMLADDYKKRVMIVDTSNEIGGDGDIPHAGIGNARRLQVPNSNMQHKVLIEAVENHMPQVIIIDEIGTKLEALAASTIAQRGIQLVATAHGVTIENLIMNPSLEMLVGGIQSVTLGDEEASRRGVQKTVLERKGPSTFTCGVEIISKTELQIHRNLEVTVDALLAGRSPYFDIRQIDPKGSTYERLSVQKDSSNKINDYKQDVVIIENDFTRSNESSTIEKLNPEPVEKHVGRSHWAGVEIHLFVYGITETSVLQAVKQLGMDDIIALTDNISEANAFLGLQSKLKKNSQIQAVAKSYEIPIFVTKMSSLMQITKAIRSLVNDHVKQLKEFDTGDQTNSFEKMDALEEARLAIEKVVIPKGESAQLLPRPSHIISVQIELIESYKLSWKRVGQEPNVFLCVLPQHPDIKEKSPTDRVVGTGSDSEDLSSSDDMNVSPNGVARLPLLPE